MLAYTVFYPNIKSLLLVASQNNFHPKQLGFRSLFSSLSEAIGGWPAMAGLASAAVTGIFIGISPPQGLIDPIGVAFGDTSILSESLEYGDGFDFTQYEG